MARQWLNDVFEWVATCWEGTRAAIRALTLIRFNLVLGVICSLALYTGQGQDILRALVEVEPWYHNAFPRLCFLLFTLSFALTAWYFARVMFLFQFPADVDQEMSLKRVSSETVKHHVTRWLGPVILFMVAGAIVMAARSYESITEPASLQLLAMALFLGACGTGVLYMAYREGTQWSHVAELDKAEYQHVREFMSLPKVTRQWFWAANIASVVAFIVFSYQAGVIGPWIGTAGILMLWATTLVAIGGALVYAGNQYRIPVIGFIVILVVVFSLFNDNHRVRQTITMHPYEQQQSQWTQMPKAILTAMLEFTKGIVSRSVEPPGDAFESYFLAWFKDLQEQRKKKAWNQPMHDAPIPIVLVSTEGGGIRAAYWTAAVLAELQDRSDKLIRGKRIPLDFARHVFSISGVSGGSLGAAVFAGLMKERHHLSTDGRHGTCELTAESPVRQVAQQILEQDFLSPTVGVLLFPDMFQRFLPFGILDDRALALEHAWERAWSDCVGSNRFTMPFDTLWEHQHFSVPLLFLNSTVVETGQRIIMHPLPFVTPHDKPPIGDPTPTGSSSFQEYFNNALDGPAVLGGQVPLSTAVHMSARFTYVSPAGTIFRQDLPEEDSGIVSSEPKVIRVVDGGYFENSGAVTTDEILLAIRRIAADKKLRIHPIVIHISNDPLKPKTRKRKEFTGSRAFLPEILSPVWALLNVRPARGYQAREELGGRAELGLSSQRTGERAGGAFVHFQLCEYERRLPLGWMLSDLTRQDMDQQLPSNGAPLHGGFKTIAQFNRNNLNVVLDGLAGDYHESANQTDLLTDYDRDCKPSSTTES